jgi:hypothetical protein
MNPGTWSLGRWGEHKNGGGKHASGNQQNQGFQNERKFKTERAVETTKDAKYTKRKYSVFSFQCSVFSFSISLAREVLAPLLHWAAFQHF